MVEKSESGWKVPIFIMVGFGIHLSKGGIGVVCVLSFSAEIFVNPTRHVYLLNRCRKIKRIAWHKIDKYIYLHGRT